jgi:hypothetical protein
VRCPVNPPLQFDLRPTSSDGFLADSGTSSALSGSETRYRPSSQLSRSIRLHRKEQNGRAGKSSGTPRNSVPQVGQMMSTRGC